jgi:hypothetical protein
MYHVTKESTIGGDSETHLNEAQASRTAQRYREELDPGDPGSTKWLIRELDKQGRLGNFALSGHVRGLR